MADVALTKFYQGWDIYQNRLVKVVSPLTTDQLALRAAPELRSIGTLVAHIVSVRTYWFHGILGEGSDELDHTLGWDDHDPVAQSAAELVNGLEGTWRLVADALAHWTPADLEQTFKRTRRSGEVNIYSRQWIIWHVIEHDLHHGGELSYSLGMHGLAPVDI